MLINLFNPFKKDFVLCCKNNKTIYMTNKKMHIFCVFEQLMIGFKIRIESGFFCNLLKNSKEK